MISLLKIKYTNYINLILFLGFFLVIFFINVKKLGGKQASGIVASFAKSYKYKINYLNINFKSNESIFIEYPNSFFNVEEFLQIKIGDSLQYNLLSNNKVSKIKNLKNNNELNELYFSFQESNGFQILIIFLLIVFNIIQMKKLRDIKELSRVDNNPNKYTLIKKINDFTKKHPIITVLGLSIVVYFFYLMSSYITQNQIIFDNIYFYKYLILLLGFLIPMPFVLVNYKLLKEVNLSKR